MGKGPDSLALYYPDEAWEVCVSADWVRRAARVAKLIEVRVLQVGWGPGTATTTLAKDANCKVVSLGLDHGLVAQSRERVKSKGDKLKVDYKSWDGKKLPFGAAGFDAVWVDGGLGTEPGEILGQVRPLLALSGRAVFTYPVRVGRHQDRALFAHWEAKTGAPLMLPRELLCAVEGLGFEPQAIETLGDEELDLFYRAVESSAGGLKGANADLAASLCEEAALHRGQTGKSTVSFARVIARRKEPGEKPAPSRDTG